MAFALYSTISFIWIYVIITNFYTEAYSVHPKNYYSYGSEHRNVIPGEYVFFVKKDFVKNGVPEFVSRLIDKYGINIKPQYDVSFGDMHAYLVSGITEGQVEYVRHRYGLMAVEANRIVAASAITYKDYLKSTDTATNMSSRAPFCFEQETGRNLWGLSRIDQREQLRRNGHYRWSYNDDGYGVNVYVIDSGCHIEHQEFGGRARRGFTAKHLLEREGDDDLNGHGTHVSGTIAGTTFGVAKAANIIAVKTLDRDGVGTIADIVQGLGYVYSDVQNNKVKKAVINLSLGAEGTSVSLENAIAKCIKMGIHVVVASGNDFDDSCQYTPAHVAEAITVSASNINDGVSAFSNYGACVDLFAPGEAIMSAYIGGSDTYAVSDGTSMASPHVTGAVARYISHFPSTEKGPTPADVALYFDTLATRGALDFSILPKTPAAQATQNRILFIECSRATTIYSNASSITFFALGYYFIFMPIGYLGRRLSV